MTQQSTVEEQYNKLVQIVHKYWDLGDEVGLHKEVLKEIQLAEQKAMEEERNRIIEIIENKKKWIELDFLQENDCDTHMHELCCDIINKVII